MSPSHFNDDDLRGFDLTKLELEHIELDIDRPAHPFWRWLVGLSLLGIAGGILYLQSSDVARAYGGGTLDFVLALAAVGLGLAAGRWLWRTAEASRRDADEERGAIDEGPPSALRRTLTLLAGLGGGGAVIYFRMAGDGSTDAGFAVAVGAVVVGVILGRWLLMQGDAARANAADEPKIELKLPPWFKWVSLTGVILLGVIAATGESLFGGAGDPSTGFWLGGVAFAAGILGAIWLARRFEETEERHKPRRSGRPGS